MAPKKAKGPSTAEPPGKDKGGKDKAKPATANATTSPAEAKPPDRPPGFIEMKPFQRLPKEVLHNHCQKHKMPKPQYEQRRAPKGFFKTECILSNPKDSSKTMRFLTNEEFPFKNHSENFSALLALFHLEPTRPYEKLFPSPFREAWLSLSGDTPQQQQQQQQQQQGGTAAGGPKKPSAKAKTTKGASTAQPAKDGAAAADAGENGLAAAGAARSTEAAGAAAAGAAVAGRAAAGPAATGASTRASQQNGLGTPQGVPPGVSDASPSGEVSGPPKGAPFRVQISSAHRFASEFERQQAAESKRLEKVRKEKEKELQRLEEEAQMPTVFMAELVRKKAAQTLRELLPHVAAARSEPEAAAAAAAASAAAETAASASAASTRKAGETTLLPLQWTDTKWMGAVSWALRRQLNSQRAVGTLKTSLMRELTGPLQFDKGGAVAAVEAAVAALLSAHPLQPQQPHHDQQHPSQKQQKEATALQQLLESCQDFIALNITDEGLLPPHFSPAGKQIEIRCHSATSEESQEQKEQQQQQQQDEKRTHNALLQAKDRFLAALTTLTSMLPQAASCDSLMQLAEALSSLCHNTGLHGVAAGVLEQQLQQQQQQKEGKAAVAAAGAALSDACAAVAAASAAVVGSSEDRERRNLLERLGGPQLLSDAAVLKSIKSIKDQEMEAAESLLECSPLRLSAAETAESSLTEEALKGLDGFYLQAPLDAATASSVESCLKASLGADCMQGGGSQGLPPQDGALVLHVLSPPGSLYPFDPPVAWVGVKEDPASPRGVPMQDKPPPYGPAAGAILCGAFAAHNASRLARPLQHLSAEVSSRQETLSPPVPKLLSVLASPTCETTVSEVAALLHAAWQLEAHFDDLLAQEPKGSRGMHARWVAAATGATSVTPAGGAALAQGVEVAGAAVKKETDERQQEEQWRQQDNGDSRGSPISHETHEGQRNRKGLPGGPSTATRPGGELNEKETELCKNIINSVNTAASADALGLPVRQHFDAVVQFVADPSKRVLVLQGETGSGKTTQLPRMLLEAAARLALQQQHSSSSSRDQFPAYIVCTQPRRLAAVSVASRVATEMGVPLGGLVGYQVRLESRVTPQTRLLFCTHGVLLRQLLSGDALERVSIVVVDEVHERCTEVDMLLLVLAKALAMKQHNLKVVVMSASLAVEHFASYFRRDRLLALQGNLSSLNQLQREQLLWQQQQLLLREEGGRGDSSVEVLKVPGRTFPVSVHFLEEVLKMCDPAYLPSAYQGPAAAAAAAAAEARFKGGRPQTTKTEWREQQQDTFACTTSDGPDKKAAAAAAAVAGVPVGALPQLPQLVAAVVRHVHLTGTPCSKNPPGDTRGSRGNRQKQQQQQQRAGTAIIVFCSGVGEVSAVCRAIEELQMDLWVLPCHASLHPKQQQKVFAPPPSGWRKVVVATNIAETSITISDVGYVVDCGTHKVLRYDPAKRSSKLQEELITKANAQQRRGRAGRVSEGCCLRLYQQEEFADMAPVETPELHRQALDNVCLQLKAIFPNEPLHSLFSQCLDPPAQEHIDASIRHLAHLGALECVGGGLGETLTPLGLYLSRFPMSIAFAKMLIFAAPLGCLEETLALCSLMAADAELYLPGAEAAAERQKYFARSQSDFVSSLRVFAAWEAAVAMGRAAEDAFCLRFGVNANTCRAAEALRKRFRRVAREAGLLAMMPAENADTRNSPTKEIASKSVRPVPSATAATTASRSSSSSTADDCGSDSGDEVITLRVEEISPVASRSPPKGEGKDKMIKDSINSISWYIKACVVAGLYPQVATIQAPRTYMTVGSGTLEKTPEAWQMKFFTRVDAEANSPQEERRNVKQKLQRVFIHPTSVNFKNCEFDTQWVAFSEKLQTTKVFIKDVSTVSVFALLLLSCCELVPSQGQGAVWLDGWLQLRCPGLISSYVKHLKGLFHFFLNEFYSLSAISLTRREQQLQQQGELDYDLLALREHAAAPSKTKFVFFGTPEALQRRQSLTMLVKRLVELEGHLV